MIPLMIDLAGKTVVIFGGGDVGSRKAGFFCREARVMVVSRSFSAALSTIPVTKVTMDLDSISDDRLESLLNGAALAIAATPDRELNNRIGKCCARMGVLFNNADGQQGSVLIPSVVRGTHYTIAISTKGASPAVSRYLRELLESSCPHLDNMIDIQERLRLYLKGSEPSPQKRRDVIWQALRDHDVWEALGQGEEAAWDLIVRRYLS